VRGNYTLLSMTPCLHYCYMFCDDESCRRFSDDVMCSLSECLLQPTQNQPMVTLDQEQKEELFYEVFNEYGDNPIPEY